MQAPGLNALNFNLQMTEIVPRSTNQTEFELKLKTYEIPKNREQIYK